MIAIAPLTVAALVLLASAAQAQNNRSFVSSAGSDGNPCTLAAPCRTFAQAVSQTNASGEVAVLNTGGYGPVTITKAISIVNQDGIEAGITATAGHGITIAAGPGDVVNLRGLTITGIGNNTGSGINVTSGSTLKIENCAISGFLEYGISIQVSADTKFTITDTVASNNGLSGVYLFHSSGSLYGTLARVTLVNNGNGLSLSSGVLAPYEIILSNSIVSNNTNNGISGLGGTFNVLVLQSQLSGNSTGINVSTGSGIYLSQSSLFNNLDINDTSCGGAFIESLQNNFYGTTSVCTKITAATLH